MKINELSDNLRVKTLASINGKEVYPVPADLYENGVHWGLKKKLMNYFDLQDNDSDGLYLALGACMRWGMPRYTGPELEIMETDHIPDYPQIRVAKNVYGMWTGFDSYSDTLLSRPLANANLQEVKNYKWPKAEWYDYRRICWALDEGKTVLPIEEWALKYKDYVRVVGGFKPVLCNIFDLFGMQKAMENILLEPEITSMAAGCIGEYLEGYYEGIGNACQGYADIMAFGDDFAGQNGMLISPDQFRQFFIPIWKRLFAIAHKYNLKTLMHMCGSIRPVIGDLIDAGLDIYENFVTNCPGMNINELKQEYGNDLIFYGGIDVQNILPFSKPQEVEDEVKRIIEIAGKNGKFILSSCHSLTDDIPVENVIAMYKAAGSLNAY
jgi:uroporphyrinogen decarboxylase